MLRHPLVAVTDTDAAVTASCSRCGPELVPRRVHVVGDEDRRRSARQREAGSGPGSWPLARHSASYNSLQCRPESVCGDEPRARASPRASPPPCATARHQDERPARRLLRAGVTWTRRPSWSTGLARQQQPQQQCQRLVGHAGPARRISTPKCSYSCGAMADSERVGDAAVC